MGVQEPGKYEPLKLELTEAAGKKIGRTQRIRTKAGHESNVRIHL